MRRRSIPWRSATRCRSRASSITASGPRTRSTRARSRPTATPRRAWEEQARYAINGLYPRLREGVDWAIGRKTIDGDLELLEGEKAGVDWGKVQEAAKKLAGNDPYTTYKPKKGIGQPRDEGYDLGERHKEFPNRELPPNVAQSEVNPKSNEKVPSQAYPTNPPRTSQGAAISEDDPNFNEDGTRKLPPPEGYDEEEVGSHGDSRRPARPRTPSSRPARASVKPASRNGPRSR